MNNFSHMHTKKRVKSIESDPSNSKYKIEQLFNILNFLSIKTVIEDYTSFEKVCSESVNFLKIKSIKIKADNFRTK